MLKGSFAEGIGSSSISGTDLTKPEYETSESDSENVSPVEPDCDDVEIFSDTELQNVDFDNFTCEDERQEDRMQCNQSQPEMESSESSLHEQKQSCSTALPNLNFPMEQQNP